MAMFEDAIFLTSAGPDGVFETSDDVRGVSIKSWSSHPRTAEILAALRAWRSR